MNKYFGPSKFLQILSVIPTWRGHCDADCQTRARVASARHVPLPSEAAPDGLPAAAETVPRPWKTWEEEEEEEEHWSN